MWRLELRWVFFNIFISDLQPWAQSERAKLSGDTKPFRREMETLEIHSRKVSASVKLPVGTVE